MRQEQSKVEALQTGLEIAVIGMAGRFPDAKNIEEFWENLKNGKESITFYNDIELAENRVPGELIKDQNYVKSGGGVLEDFEYFDGNFFDYTPREVEVMDPQIRIFHECCWEALENAGYDPYSYKGLIGLYAGASNNINWQALIFFSGKTELLGAESQLLSNKDFLCSRISYKLSLNGPSVVVQTACSTSLFAVHMACRSLLTKECDIALAGGISVRKFNKSGYLYQKNMIIAPDGHCRAFDERSEGSIDGNGVGIVVLKKLKDAVDAGDNIYAVVKGSAVNNDGNNKVGYTAPSVKGETDVIKTATYLSQVNLGSISYIEAHGTGTILGDPIEIQALKEVFPSDRKHFCSLGTVKSNIGHLDAAAGAAGLIKTVLALKHRQIPPSLHFEKPNPQIDFANSPFYVNTVLKEWKHEDNPLRAGVSSFGIGGTNVHVILEEAPQLTHCSSIRSRDFQLVLLSAKTEAALETLTGNLLKFLEKKINIDLADIAYTLQVGRHPFGYKMMSVCANRAEAIRDLTDFINSDTASLSRKIKVYFSKGDKKFKIFMFPGVGAQYINMGLGLYRREPFFREEMDRCFEILESSGYDFKGILYPASFHSIAHKNNGHPGLQPDGKQVGEPEVDINRAFVSQPLLFIFEYALAKLLMKWGIKPEAMIGYSLGEYVAACIAGVFSLKDALTLVLYRSKLIESAPPGAMLSVPLAGISLKPLLEEFNSEHQPRDTHDNNHNLPAVSLAIDNGNSCIVAGTIKKIAVFEKFLKEKKYMCMRLQASGAVHSAMMASIAREFEEKVRKISLDEPQIPYISNVTGYWIAAEDAVDPKYWTRHLLETVKFADGIKELIKEPESIFIEVGPGRDLCALIANQIDKDSGQDMLNLIKTPEKDISDEYYLLNKLGQLWLHGINIDWLSFYSEEKRYRVPLPTYPFERQRYMIDASVVQNDIERKPGNLIHRKQDIEDWFYIPSWNRTVLPVLDAEQITKTQCWLIFIDDYGFALKIVEQLEKEEQHIVIVRAGYDFKKINSAEYIINPRQVNDYEILRTKLNEGNFSPERIIHCWSITGEKTGALNIDKFEKAQYLGFYSLVYLTKALSKNDSYSQIRVEVLSDNIHEVIGDEFLCPEKATILAPGMVISQEYPNISCRSIDIVFPEPDSWQEKKVVDILVKEFKGEPANPLIAYRNGYRFEKVFSAVKLTEPKDKIPVLRDKGVYLITGGLGRIGLTLAEYLVKAVKARLILTGRSQFPVQEEWGKWLDSHDENDSVSKKIRILRELLANGGEILIRSVNVANLDMMEALVSEAEDRFDAINGVIHAAGEIGGAILSPIARMNELHCQQQFEPKIRGLLVLEKIFNKKNLDFCISTSSLSSILGGLGLTAYSAANHFMDVFIHMYNRTTPFQWMSVNWADWIFNQQDGTSAAKSAGAHFGISPVKGIETFARILANPGFNQVIVSAGDINARYDTWVKLKSVREEEKTGGTRKFKLDLRPALMNAYVAPQNEYERKLAAVWQDIFGYGHIGVIDNFFELGGNSLKAITAISKISRELNVNISIVEFFHNPTIQKLEKLIRNKSRSDYIQVGLVEKREYYTISSAQKRLYILQQMNPQNINYNLFETLHFDVEFDKNKLEYILKKLINRHESLRTYFEIINGTPVQRILEMIDFKILFYEIKEEKEFVGIIQNFTQPFDLKKAPLFRYSLIKLMNNKYIGLIEMHHIITDGVSQAILTRDFYTLFSGKELPSLRLQYKDFSEWQTSIKQHELLKSQEKYWIDIFSGELPVLNLPLDFPRPAIQSFIGASTGFMLIQRETEIIKQLAEKNDVTLFMLLLSVFTILLAKLSNQEDIIVGIPTAGRRQVDLENIIGIFINTLPIRSFPHRQKTYQEFLHEVKQNTLAAYENQEYQFEDLVDMISVRRDTSRNPIFDVILNLMNQPDYKKTNLEIEEKGKYQHVASNSRFDLTITVIDFSERLYFGFEYCTKLFKAEFIDRIIGYFRRILSGLTKNLVLKVADIEIMSQDEKNQVLNVFNDTGADYQQIRTVHSSFEDQVWRTPDCIALTYEDQKMTYKELNTRAEYLAKYLIFKGVGRGTIVAVLLDRSAEIMLAIYGILKAGSAYLPLDPDHPANRIEYVLKESLTGIILTNNAKYKAPEVESVDINDKNFHTNCCVDLVPSNSAEDAAYVTYTSGSTGFPKGVIIRHRNVTNFIEGISRVISFSGGDTVLSLTTVSFDIFGLETIHPLTKGAMVLIGNYEEQIDNHSLSLLMNKEQVTIFQVTPTRLKYLLDDFETAKSLSLLKSLLIGGEELPVKLFNSVKTITTGKIFNLYGPTETTIWSTLKNISQDEAVTIGRPILNTQVYILDKAYRLQVPGIVGEIYINGEGLAQGYLNNIELTQERFSSDPFKVGGKLYKTGDLGRWLLDGNIECLGRIDYQVKIRGFRVELGEIESRILAIDCVAEALLAEQEDAAGDKYLCAYIVLKDDKKKKEVGKETGEIEREPAEIRNTIRSHLIGHLPDYMIPAYFVELDEIPLTPNGKIDRKKLPLPQTSIGKDYTAPRDEIEEKLVEIWAEVLGLQKEAIGIDDNFFEIGGNSLKIINVERKIKDRLQKDIPVIELFTYSTIRLISDYLGEGKKALILPEEDRSEIIKTGKDKLKEKRRRAAEAVI